MTDEFFSGKWEGYYAHGEQYSEDRRKIKVGFHVKMVLKDGVLSGTCEEYITRVHMGKPAILTGSIEGNHIRFVKQYPYAYEVDKDREITIDKNRLALPVHYSGVFEPANNTFYGDWKIEAVRGEEETWLGFREDKGEGLPGDDEGILEGDEHVLESGENVGDNENFGDNENDRNVEVGGDNRSVSENWGATQGTGSNEDLIHTFTGSWEMRKI